MMPQADVLRFKLESRLDSIDLAQFLSESLVRLRCSDEAVIFHVGLSMRESVTNAICHGNGEDSAKHVDIEFQVYPDRIVIQVDDAGSGFDPSAVPDPLAPENLLKPSGRGILFIRSMMDQVEFLRSPAGGTRLKMVKITAAA